MQSKQPKIDPYNFASKPTVFVGGLPKCREVESVDHFMKSIASKGIHNIIIDAKKKLRGFAFITFETMKEAQDFLKKEHRYEGKLLDCKMSLEHNDYISSSLINLREPKKVFVDDVPNIYSKQHLLEVFKSFGKVKELITIDKFKKDLCFVYVKFVEFESAKKAISQGTIEIDKDHVHQVRYAKPKFSKKILDKVPEEIRGYIREIQRNERDYDPDDFSKIEDAVLKMYDIKDKKEYYNLAANEITKGNYKIFLEREKQKDNVVPQKHHQSVNNHAYHYQQQTYPPDPGSYYNNTYADNYSYYNYN